MNNLKDKNYTKSFVLYKILWYPHLNALERLVLEAILSAEQEYHKTIANRFTVSLRVVMTYEQLMELTGIGSIRTIRKCLATLEQYDLVKVKKGKRTGIATEFTPIKPIPIPSQINIPSWYKTTYGEDKINTMIEELRELHIGSISNSVVEQEEEPASIEDLLL